MRQTDNRDGTILVVSNYLIVTCVVPSRNLDPTSTVQVSSNLKAR